MTKDNFIPNDHHFEAYASTFGDRTRDGDIMIEGCFDKTVANKAVVPMCLNHDRDRVIGKHELVVDEKGLRTRSTFNLSDPEAKKIYDLMKMGALDSLSIGFRIKDMERTLEGRLIKEAEVYEVSVATVPANPNAIVIAIR